MYKNQYCLLLLFNISIVSCSYIFCGDSSKQSVFLTEEQFKQYIKWLEQNKDTFQQHTNNNNTYSTQVGDGAFVLPNTPGVEDALSKYLENNYSWETYLKQGLSGAISQGGGALIANGGTFIFSEVRKKFFPSRLEKLTAFNQEGDTFTSELLRFVQVYNAMPPTPGLEKQKLVFMKLLAERTTEFAILKGKTKKPKSKARDRTMSKKYLEEFNRDLLSEREKSQDKDNENKQRA